MRRCRWCPVLVVTEHVGRKSQGEENKTFSSPATRPGEEEEETVPPQNDTVSSPPFFFLNA